MKIENYYGAIMKAGAKNRTLGLRDKNLATFFVDGVQRCLYNDVELFNYMLKHKYFSYSHRLSRNFSFAEIIQATEDVDFEVLDYLVKYGHNSKDVKEALDRVKHAQALRKEFSANVTHELKSPLTSINGYAEMIESGMTTYDQAKDFAKIIHEQGNRLLTMIDETIKLSKFDNNYVKTERFSLFNLNDMIEQNIKSLTKFAHGKNVTLEYEPNDTLFYGNDKLMDDLIRNMISNGIKYSKEDGGMVKIILKENLDEIILKFIDQGIGIAEENQERIFERFYVINKSRDRKTGTGLGLSLVKNIALMHKGKVEVLSKLDRGSEFIITFPKLMENDYK